MSEELLREKVAAPERWRRWFPGSRTAQAASASWSIPHGQGVLAVHRLGKGYRGRMVVQDVSISVRRGEAVGLLGPNGAGKTTVFYMITGLVKPDKGEIVLDGHDVTGLPMFQRARLGVGYLPQEASIFRGLNVEDNIRAVLEVNEPSSEGGDEAVTADRAIAQTTRLTARSSANRQPHLPRGAYEKSQRFPAAAVPPMSWPVVHKRCVHATVD